MPGNNLSLATAWNTLGAPTNEAIGKRKKFDFMHKLATRCHTSIALAAHFDSKFCQISDIKVFFKAITSAP